MGSVQFLLPSRMRKRMTHVPRKAVFKLSKKGHVSLRTRVSRFTQKGANDKIFNSVLIGKGAPGRRLAAQKE